MTGLSFQEGSKLAEKLGTLVGPLPYSPVIVDYPSICSQFHIKEAGKSLPTVICYLFSLIQYSIYKVILNYKREPNLVVQCNEVFIFQFFSTVQYSPSPDFIVKTCFHNSVSKCSFFKTKNIFQIF